MIKKFLIACLLVAYLVSPVSAAGIIIGWDEPIANIPSGWNLCDGNSGRPNLLDKYLKSVGTSEDPGATGGADTHSHTSPAHTHIQDGHSHSGQTGNADYLVWRLPLRESSGAYAGKQHNHAVTLASVTAVNQNATVTLASTSNDPPYYKLAFIYDSAVNRYPVGSVILWNSATLPNGWSLHEGLKNVFAKCVGSGENPGGTGGSSNSHTHTNTAHNHTQDAHSHSTSYGSSSNSAGGAWDSSAKQPTLISHTHTISSNSATATNQSSSVTINNGDGQPAFYKLSYIKNTGSSANRPKNSIVNWSGTIANIPNGYVLCDGTNGTFDLRDYFVKGANDSSELGNTGGSATHLHTATSHNHIQDSHSHTIPQTGNNPTPPNAYVAYTSYYDNGIGVHYHDGFSVSGTVTNQATTITIDSVNSEPPYYKMAFIMQNIDLDVGAYAFISD